MQQQASIPQRVDVTVSVTKSGCIVCSPDPVVVKSPDAVLNFHLATAGYRFREDDPIVVDNPGSAFPYPSRTHHGTTATLVDCDQSRADYSYSVYLLDPKGQVVTGD